MEEYKTISNLLFSAVEEIKTIPSLILNRAPEKKKGTAVRSNEKTVASWPMGTWERPSYLNFFS